MGDENQNSFNLDDFIISTNDGNGELTVERNKTPEQKEQELQTQQQQNNQVPDFSVFDNKIGSIEQTVQRQSNAIAQLIQYTLSKEQKPETLDNEILGNVFGDADKGTTFLNTLTAQIENIIDKKLGPINNQLAPIAQNNQLNAEIQQITSQPDFANYAQGTHMVLSINRNLTLPQAFAMAKQMGMRVETKQQPINNTQNTNVTDINQRRQLPNRTNSSNVELKTKQIGSVRDALEAALEELGA